MMCMGKYIYALLYMIANVSFVALLVHMRVQENNLSMTVIVYFCQFRCYLNEYSCACTNDCMYVGKRLNVYK